MLWAPSARSEWEIRPSDYGVVDLSGYLDGFRDPDKDALAHAEGRSSFI